MIKACLILRDEQHCIARTLASIVQHVDSFCVVDTGSTDGTPAIVRAFFGQHHIPGEVHVRPFIDYATTRNECLELAGTDEPFLLMLDAEDELINGDSLRFLLQVAKDGSSCWQLRQRWPGGEVHVPRIVRAGSPWRYVGKVHELLTHPDGRQADMLLGPWILHVPTAIGEARSRARWPRDVQLLREHLAEHPDDARAQWHLERTLEALAFAHSQQGAHPPS